MSNYQGVQFYPRCCRGTISNSCRSCYCCWSMLFFLRIIADSIYPHDSPWSNIKKTKGNLFKTAGSQAYLEADINEMMPHATEIRLLDISERMENQQPTSGGIARKGPPCLRLLNHLRDKAVGVLLSSNAEGSTRGFNPPWKIPQLVLFFGICRFWRSSFNCHHWDQKACREQRPKDSERI